MCEDLEGHMVLVHTENVYFSCMSLGRLVVDCAICLLSD